MKLSINLFMTLDGVSQSPGSPQEDPRDGFTHGGWLMPLFDEGSGRVVDDWFSRCTALLLGRRTYDTFASHWPQVTDTEDRVAAQINQGPKYVVTSSAVGEPWARTTTVLEGNFLDKIQQLKSSPGDELQVHGSIRLARALHQVGMVEVYRFLLAPVVVGGGAGIFDAEGPAFTMAASAGSVTENGLVALELTPGEFRAANAAVQDGKDAIQQPSRPAS